MCPISNVRTGVVSDLASHPIRRYFDAGLLVTANSDDPTMFQTDLANEYRQLEAVQAWTRPEICQLVLNAIEAAWVPSSRKSALADEFRADPNWVM
jgi:adenosine deaminase